MELESRLARIVDIVVKNNVTSLENLKTSFKLSERTLQRDLKELKAVSSFTHRGRFITLPRVSSFDDNGIWFYQNIGFTVHKNSLGLIIFLINKKEAMTKSDLESVLKINIAKQIQILRERSLIQRVKVGAKYYYLSEVVAKDKKRQIQLFSSEVENDFDRKINISDLTAILKALLKEKTIVISDIQRVIRVHALNIPLRKVEHIILQYDLTSKKNSKCSKGSKSEISTR